MRFAIMVGLALGTAVVVLVIVAAIDKKREKKMTDTYIRVLLETYPQSGILEAIMAARKSFKEKSCEWMALDKAAAYLQKSILRDYKTAFAIVERGFPRKKVAETHSKILQEMQGLLALPLKENQEQNE